MNGRPFDHYTYRGKRISNHAHPHGGRKAAPSRPAPRPSGVRPNATNLSAIQGRNIAKASLDKEAGRISRDEYKRIISENTPSRAPGATRVQGGSTEVPRTEFKPAPQSKIGKANTGKKVTESFRRVNGIRIVSMDEIREARRRAGLR